GRESEWYALRRSADRRFDGSAGRESEWYVLHENDDGPEPRHPQVTLMAPYERFEAWQLCHQLVLAIYHVTASFPREELYGLTAQARRAAFSAAANIAEGSAKRGRREFRRYLDISVGSLSELSYIIRLARDLKMLKVGEAKKLEDLHTRASQVTWKLYQSMRVR
ncbi:MAG: four helix bundle protein, partial [Gemmatimonadales bacterium]|nr:four helix bundle protein [Gemmatimonadales bacterium]NIN12264.1 four helix bundle protein [Gemmatimonadales bacterium]NIN50666.1 four helix bundle protein [Gemmatimonadales bacterium]NIP08130.1 four helix bundle protein [Gemmatimonadales bacterium]NIR03423.1 four helix bundle protein [Gemmatimonadales bacterium]